MEDQLAETWNIHDRINRYLLNAVPVEKRGTFYFLLWPKFANHENASNNSPHCDRQGNLSSPRRLFELLPRIHHWVKDSIDIHRKNH